MTKKEKDRILLELYSLYNKSLYGVIELNVIKNNALIANIAKNDGIESILMKLHEEYLLNFEYKLLPDQSGKIIEIRIKGGVNFTEKGFDYLKELRKNKFLKLWELLYKYVLPIGYVIDIVYTFFSFFQRK